MADQLAQEIIDKIKAHAEPGGEEITVDYRSFNLVPEGIKCWCPEGRCQI